MKYKKIIQIIFSAIFILSTNTPLFCSPAREDITITGPTVKWGRESEGFFTEKKPALIRETSYKSWWERINTALSGYFRYEEPSIKFQDTLVLSPELEGQLCTVARSTQMISKDSNPHPSLMLYGPPGTGKTSIAKLLAHMSGMDYVITSAYDFLQLSESHFVQELRALLDWAKQIQNGMIIVIDDLDAIVASHNKVYYHAFLEHIKNNCSTLKIIGLTTRIHGLNGEFINQFPQKINVPLPSLDERFLILKKKMDTYLFNNKCVPLSVADDINDDYVRILAQRFEGLSGCDLDQIISEVRFRAYRSGKNLVTREIIKSVAANEKVEIPMVKQAEVALAQQSEDLS